MSIRLNKLLAERGLGARRKCDDLIAAGVVRVNGEVVREPGTQVEPERDRIQVRGRALPDATPHVYYALHKPVGVITTLSDPEGRRTIADMLPPGRRVFPVGRLDADTSGLLLLTNDGELAHKLMHPRYGVLKSYRVVTDRVPDARMLDRLRDGIEFEPGVVSSPAQIRVRDETPGDSVIEIAIHEGRYRQVRRMCEAAGLTVQRLHRWAYGPLRLGHLARGLWRELSEREVRELKAISARPQFRPRGSGRPARPSPAAGAFAMRERAPRQFRGVASPAEARRRDRAPNRPAASPDATRPESASPAGRPTRGKRPSFGPREERPSFGPRRERPTSGSREERPSFGPRRERPTSGPREERPLFGPRRERPSYSPRGERPAAGGRPERSGFTSRAVRVDRAPRDERPGKFGPQSAKRGRFGAESRRAEPVVRQRPASGARPLAQRRNDPFASPGKPRGRGPATKAERPFRASGESRPAFGPRASGRARDRDRPRFSREGAPRGRAPAGRPGGPRRERPSGGFGSGASRAGNARPARAGGPRSGPRKSSRRRGPTRSSPGR